MIKIARQKIIFFNNIMSKIVFNQEIDAKQAITLALYYKKVSAVADAIIGTCNNIDDKDVEKYLSEVVDVDIDLIPISLFNGIKFSLQCGMIVSDFVEKEKRERM